MVIHPPLPAHTCSQSEFDLKHDEILIKNFLNEAQLPNAYCCRSCNITQELDWQAKSLNMILWFHLRELFTMANL